MQTIKLSDANARKMYPSASPEIKQILEDSFTKDFFSQKITDRIKTFEDACSALNKEPNDVLPDGVPADDTKSIVAYCKLIIIARALNEGWTPDWTDSSQYKWVPWFEHKSGFGLSYYVYVNWHSVTVVGSRLCFKSKELAEYAATQFADIYMDFLTL